MKRTDSAGKVDNNLPSEEKMKQSSSNNAIINWFGKRSVAGAGMLYKFTHIENRLVRWILEKHGFKESVQDYGMPPADFYNIANA